MNFEDWMEVLCEIAAKAGYASQQDPDAWRSDYEDGKSPEEAWTDEWGAP